jgi:histidyl-tRNA synthetase
MDSKSEADKSILKNAPLLMDHLDPMEKTRFEQVLAHLQVLGIPFTIEPYLIRGLDYYNDTVFEITHVGHDDSLVAGGRYDELASIMSQNTLSRPALGCAAGLDRLLDFITTPETVGEESIAVIPVCSDHERTSTVLSICLKVVQHLRLEGICSSLIFEESTATRKTTIALQRYRSSSAIFVGMNEIAGETLTVKNFKTRSQFSIPMVKFFSVRKKDCLEKLLREDGQERAEPT